MADGHGGVAAFGLAHQEMGDWLADDVAASDDDRMLARGLDAGADQHLDDAVRRARQEAGLANHHAAHIDRREAVHILFRCDGVNDGGLIDMFRKRKLHKNAVDARVGIHLLDEGQGLRLRGFSGHADIFRMHAGLFAGFLLGRDVRGGSRVKADEDHTEAGGNALGRLEICDLLCDICAHICRELFAVEYVCWHLGFLSERGRDRAAART